MSRKDAKTQSPEGGTQSACCWFIRACIALGAFEAGLGVGTHDAILAVAGVLGCAQSFLWHGYVHAHRLCGCPSRSLREKSAS
ncbi:MAG: hypothetical protein ACREIA_15115 [Opitutaceae bacterium]